MSYIIRILQNGDGLWFVAGYDPHPFTISLTETYDEAVEEARRFSKLTGYTIAPPGELVAFPSKGGAA